MRDCRDYRKEEMAANGKAVCLISSELPEILGMCGRIYTMNEGRITGEVYLARRGRSKGKS